MIDVPPPLPLFNDRRKPAFKTGTPPRPGDPALSHLTTGHPPLVDQMQVDRAHRMGGALKDHMSGLAVVFGVSTPSTARASRNVLPERKAR